MSNITLRDYQQFVEGLASPRSLRDQESRYLLSAIGLAGEAGEFADLVKKGIFHEAGCDYDKLVKELGDILWYAAFAANTLGVSLQSVLDANVAKLQDRYKSGKFTTQEFQAKEAAKMHTHSSEKLDAIAELTRRS